MTICEGFYAHPEYYDILFDWDRSCEIQFIDACFNHYGVDREAPILEIACGTGLVAIPLAKRGWDIYCLDFSSEMLDYFIKKESTQSILNQIHPICADMMDFKLETKVNAAFCTIGSIGLLDEDKDMIKHLKCMHDNLQKNAVYIIDLGISEGETFKSKYEEIIWSNSKNGITVEAEGGKVYVLEDGEEEKEFEWESIPYEYNPEHFTSLVQQSQCFKIEAWHQECELNDDGISIFDIESTTEKPKARSMLVLRAI
jgi:SAM-dependent methyltransferase